MKKTTTNKYIFLFVKNKHASLLFFLLIITGNTYSGTHEKRCWPIETITMMGALHRISTGALDKLSVVNKNGDTIYEILKGETPIWVLKPFPSLQFDENKDPELPKYKKLKEMSKRYIAFIKDKKKERDIYERKLLYMDIKNHILEIYPRKLEANIVGIPPRNNAICLDIILENQNNTTTTYIYLIAHNIIAKTANNAKINSLGKKHIKNAAKSITKKYYEEQI